MIYKEFACDTKTTRYDRYIGNSVCIAKQMQFGRASFKNFFIYQYLGVSFYEVEVIMW
jgi:hypothetical protein